MQASQLEAKTKTLERIKDFPWFVQDYFQQKNDDGYSAVTLFEYEKESRRFLSWLLREGYTSTLEINEIPLRDFQKLTTRDLSYYKRELVERTKHLPKKREDSLKHSGEALPTLSNATIKRRLTFLRSLFKYLSENQNYETNQPYLSTNPMLGVKNVNDTMNMSVRSKKMESMIFFDQEGLDWLEFLDLHYEDSLTTRQAIAAFRKNKTRDLAIIALFLGTGMRLSELVNINLNDLHVSDERIEVTVIRKGGHEDWLTVASPMLSYIQDYLLVRESTYKPDGQMAALFLTNYGGTAKRLKQNAIEKMIEKYSLAINKRTTPHKLRHSVGTQIYRKTGSVVATAELLGQTNTNSTTIYTHVASTQKKNIMDSLYD
ncbi:MAG: tyrosine recombinase XerS [Enterococcus sp.]